MFAHVTDLVTQRSGSFHAIFMYVQSFSIDQNSSLKILVQVYQSHKGQIMI